MVGYGGCFLKYFSPRIDVHHHHHFDIVFDIVEYEGVMSQGNVLSDSFVLIIVSVYDGENQKLVFSPMLTSLPV